MGKYDAASGRVTGVIYRDEQSIDEVESALFVDRRLNPTSWAFLPTPLE